ncbi:UNVERIFIED_ORG: hypothetical protein ABRZ91_001795 [Heyndrickxia coagulans]
MESGSEKPAIFKKPMENGKTAERSSGTSAKRTKKPAHQECRYIPVVYRDVFFNYFTPPEGFWCIIQQWASTEAFEFLLKVSDPRGTQME